MPLFLNIKRQGKAWVHTGSRGILILKEVRSSDQGFWLLSVTVSGRGGTWSSGMGDW